VCPLSTRRIERSSLLRIGSRSPSARHTSIVVPDLRCDALMDQHDDRVHALGNQIGQQGLDGGGFVGEA